MSDIPNPLDDKRQTIVVCEPIAKLARSVSKSLGVGGGAVAVTIGNDTFIVDKANYDKRSERHEDMHETQRQRFIRRFGKRFGTYVFWATYTAYHWIYGYEKNPLEVEAVAAEAGE